MRGAMNLEPVLVTQLIAAILSLAVAFGAPITDEQRQAVLQVVGIVVAIFLGGAVVARAHAYAPDTVRKVEALAYQRGIQVGEFKKGAGA